MADISTNPLGRTQQAGQGTAFIYEPMSKTKPLNKQGRLKKLGVKLKQWRKKGGINITPQKPLEKRRLWLEANTMTLR